MANSAWTGSRYQDVYGRPVDLVLYPPALGSSRRSEGPRQEKFLSIGRVISSKRWLSLIAIIERVRAKGHEVGLTLAGASCTPSLLEPLERLQRVHPWLTLVLDQPREEMDRLIATHRYGLHGMHHEHYGMAVAELVLGGCLTLVHDSGGQVEIVTNPEARYSDDEDAVAKIDRMLSDPQLQARLERSQRERAPLLTRERFVSELHGVLDRLEGRVPARSGGRDQL
jgi:glycosyltransferase involved in cell wall biosynthesis